MKGLKIQWSDEDIEYLKSHFPHETNKQLAAHFKIGISSIKRKAIELKLQKADDFREHIYCSQFEKDNIPWNKGLHYSPISIKFREKKFKKGHISLMSINPEIVKKCHNTRNATICRERMRLKLGWPLKTKLIKYTKS